MTTAPRPQLGLMMQFGGDRAYRPEIIQKRLDDLRMAGGHRVLLNRVAGREANAPIVIANQVSTLAANDPASLVALHNALNQSWLEIAVYSGFAIPVQGTSSNVLLDPDNPSHRILFHRESALERDILHSTLRFIDFTGDNSTETEAVSKYRLPDSDLDTPRLDRFAQFAEEVSVWGITCGNEMPKRDGNGKLDREWALTRPQIATDTGYRNNAGEEWMESAKEIGADLRMMCTESTTDDQIEQAFRCGVVCYFTERNIERGRAVYDRVAVGAA